MLGVCLESLVYQSLLSCDSEFEFVLLKQSLVVTTRTKNFSQVLVYLVCLVNTFIIFIFTCNVLYD